MDSDLSSAIEGLTGAGMSPEAAMAAAMGGVAEGQLGEDSTNSLGLGTPAGPSNFSGVGASIDPPNKFADFALNSLLGLAIPGYGLANMGSKALTGQSLSSNISDFLGGLFEGLPGAGHSTLAGFGDIEAVPGSYAQMPGASFSASLVPQRRRTA